MAPSDRARNRALLLHDDTYATVLLLLVLNEYGPDVLPNDENPEGWHPETIRMQLEQDFDVDLPKATLDKIMAAITIVTTDYFFRDVVRFIELCNVLSGDDFQPDEFDPADAAEIMWGITEALLLWPPEDERFSEEIRAYIGEVLREEGIIDPPDVLKLGLDYGGAEHVRGNFSDDPEMFQAVWEMQRQKSADLEHVLSEALRELATQLRVLPLQPAQREALLTEIAKIEANLPGTGQGDPTT